MKTHKYLLCTALFGILFLPALAMGQQLGLRYSGKSWDCIALSGDCASLTISFPKPPLFSSSVGKVVSIFLKRIRC